MAAPWTWAGSTSGSRWAALKSGRSGTRRPLAHPFHIHGVQFRTLDRDGQPPLPHERGLKDTVLVDPDSTVRVITEFSRLCRPQTSLYVSLSYPRTRGCRDDGSVRGSVRHRSNERRQGFLLLGCTCASGPISRRRASMRSGKNSATASGWTSGSVRSLAIRRSNSSTWRDKGEYAGFNAHLRKRGAAVPACRGLSGYLA